MIKVWVALRARIIDISVTNTGRIHWLPLVVSALGLSCLIAWVSVVVASLGHGFDITDEGYYLLSYRWWNVNFETFNGAQFVYGPVFQILGYNIAALRLMRLLIALGTHALFGWQFMGWLQDQRPERDLTGAWKAAGVLAIMSGAGAAYTWLPLSPGYNDLTITLALAMAGLAIRICRDGRRPITKLSWAPIILGVLSVALLLVKWTSGLTVGAVIAATLALALSPKRVLQVILRVLGEALATVIAIEVLIVPLTVAVPTMIDVNRLVASTGYAPLKLIMMYGRWALQLAESVVSYQIVFLLGASVAAILRHRIGARIAAVLGCTSFVIVAFVEHGLTAGTVNINNFLVTLFAPLVGVAAIAVITLLKRLHPVDAGTHGVTESSKQLAATGFARRSRWAVYGMLTAVPVVQALGTNNGLQHIAVVGLGFWVAAAIAVAVALPPQASAARLVTLFAVASLVASTSWLAVDGTCAHPYRTEPMPVTTATAVGVPALSSVKLAPEQARMYADIHAALEPWIVPSGRAMIAFSQMAGLVFALDGRPVGEAWYPLSVARPAAGIARACASGTPWWGDRLPLVMFNHPPKTEELAALAPCGLSLDDDYRLLIAPSSSNGNLSVYVPIDGS